MKIFVDSGFLSPYAMTAFVALREKKIPFEIETIDLAQGQQNDPRYATRSLTSRVPCITDGNFNLSESSAICEYLEDAYPGDQLYPSDIQSRARAREIQAWLRSDVMPIRVERSTEFVFLRRTSSPLSTEAQGAARKLFTAVETLLGEGEQFLFKVWSIADTDLALMISRLMLPGDDVPPRIAAYARFQWQRQSVQEWVSMQRSGH